LRSRSPFVISVAGASARFAARDVSLGIEKERSRITEILDTLESDDVFYDIGANIGLYTCLIGQHSSAVVAFEPSPRAYRILSENVRLNDVTPYLYNIALSDHDGEVLFAVDTADTLSRQSKLITVDTDVDSTKYSVRHSTVYRGQAFVADNGCPNPDIIKIDVEGAEFAVLEGLGDLLEEVRVIFCEVHCPDGGGNGATAISSFLETLGFDVDYRIEISLLRADKIQ
jgi:FkbM family methyltransferase